MQKTFKSNDAFTLESGRQLPGYHLAYTTLGNLNATADNVVWVFHALTANSDPAEWWYGMVGEGRFFDPAQYFIVCVNMPGSCYGSIGPLDNNPETGSPYYHRFPWFTTRDMIRAYQRLRLHLGIRQVYLGLGGSMGGQQLLQWAVEEPSLFKHIVPIATNAQHSPWGVAFNASQRWCITNDATWNDESAHAGMNGMMAARSIALLSYRNYDTYYHAQQELSADTVHLPIDQQVYRAETYQHYQGHKLAQRFNAFSYYFLSKGMDAHNLGRGRSSVQAALESITAKTLAVGITSDLLFPPLEQQFVAAHIPGAQYIEIDSTYGHDGFLLEFEKLADILSRFLTTEKATGTLTTLAINQQR